MGKIADKLKRRYGKVEAERNEKLEKAASKDDIRRLQRNFASQKSEQAPAGGNREAALRAVKMMGKGFGNIAKSLNSPSTEQRPRISQMPERRPDIARSFNIDKMKDPHLRGRDIRGRRDNKEV
jgi:hypothetical protein